MRRMVGYCAPDWRKSTCVPSGRIGSMGNPYEVDDGDEDGIDSLEGFFAALMLDDSGPSEAFVNAINDELVADNAAAHLIAAIRGKAFTDKQYASVAEQVRRYWNDKNTENRGIGPDGSVVTETT